MTSITIITPWLDHADLAADYFAAIRVMDEDDQLIIIDNGSTPPLDFADIHLEHNEGFHFANNVGVSTATTDAVLFLNNDVVAEDTDWLERIRYALQPGVMVGAMLRADPHTFIDGKLEPYLDGWCIAAMRDDFLRIGGWDETLEEPAYYGDNLLSLKAREAGIKLLAVDVGLRHLESTTSKSHLDWSEVSAVTSRNGRIYQQAVRELRAREAEEKIEASLRA